MPLSDAALAVLERQKAIRTNEFVFAGDSSRHANDKTLSNALKALGRRDVTPHRFRSTFSDWWAETTEFASEVREMALSHAVGNKVEEAYRRGPLLAKRRALAEA